MDSNSDNVVIETVESSIDSTDVESNVCDMPALMERCMGEADFAITMLDMFASRLPKSLEDISQILLAGDRDTTIRRVHTLKGEAGNLAADRVYRSAQKLEHALRCQQDTSVPGLMAALKLEVATFLSMVPQFTESLSHNDVVAVDPA